MFCIELWPAIPARNQDEAYRKNVDIKDFDIEELKIFKFKTLMLGRMDIKAANFAILVSSI
jgi:hypothetical protein